MVTIHARRQDAARRLAAALGVAAGAWPPPAGAWDILVNATPVGTAPGVEDAPIPLEGRLDGRLVYDLIYHPRETALLRIAAALGAETLDGLSMLAAQAAAQFTWWTGLPAPDLAMRRAALDALPADPPFSKTGCP